MSAAVLARLCKGKFGRFRLIYRGRPSEYLGRQWELVYRDADRYEKFLFLIWEDEIIQGRGEIQ